MCDLLAIGELLIDFTPKGISEQGNPIFERNPGGAPANVAVQAARLKTSVGFIGKVGDDSFGKFLKETLTRNGVYSEGVVLDKNSHTTLAFVELDKTGNRSFTFYRNKTADTQLNKEDIDYRLVDGCKLLHFGSVSLTNQPAKDTVLNLAAYAKLKGKLVSYDPNWRPLLWKDENECKTSMTEGLKYCDILKVSEEELEFLTECSDIEKGANVMLEMGIAIVIITAGKNGCYLAGKNDGVVFVEHIPTYDVPVIDTTGSGDSFFGAFLHKIIASNMPIASLGKQQLISFCQYANGAGSCCATEYGAIPAMPSDAQIEEVIKKYNLIK